MQTDSNIRVGGGTAFMTGLFGALGVWMGLLFVSFLIILLACVCCFCSFMPVAFSGDNTSVESGLE